MENTNNSVTNCSNYSALKCYLNFSRKRHPTDFSSYGDIHQHVLDEYSADFSQEWDKRYIEAKEKGCGPEDIVCLIDIVEQLNQSNDNVAHLVYWSISKDGYLQYRTVWVNNKYRTSVYDIAKAIIAECINKGEYLLTLKNSPLWRILDNLRCNDIYVRGLNLSVYKEEELRI